MAMRVAAICMASVLGAWQAWAGTPAVSSEDARRVQLLKEDGLVLVDVRSPGEFALGHIQGARNVPAARALSVDLPKDGKVVVYCSDDTCPVGRNVAEELAAAGYENVAYLEGGLAGWLARGYPVERARKARAGPKVPRIRARDAAGKLGDEGFLALDVRPVGEYESGHLPGAKSVPLEELDIALGWLPKERPILVYDRLSKRSREAARTLLKAGFDVTELAGGIAGWLRHKQPLEVR